LPRPDPLVVAPLILIGIGGVLIYVAKVLKPDIT
jgi:hypothetical protein